MLFGLTNKFSRGFIWIIDRKSNQIQINEQDKHNIKINFIWLEIDYI